MGPGQVPAAHGPLLDQWTVVAIGPLTQVLAVRGQWPEGESARLLAIVSGVAPGTAVPTDLAVDATGQCARRLGAWDGHACLPVVALVEPRGSVEMSCTGEDLSGAVAAVLAHLHQISR